MPFTGYQEYDDGAYAWSTPLHGSHTCHVRDLIGNVAIAYDNMITDAIARGLIPPNTMCGVLFSDGSVFFHSSVRDRFSQDQQIIENLWDEDHRYGGRCAEMAALKAFGAKHNFEGAVISTYGITDKDIELTGYMRPS